MKALPGTEVGRRSVLHITLISYTPLRYVRSARGVKIAITSGADCNVCVVTSVDANTLSTADWRCLAGRCASLCLQAAHCGRAAGGSG